MAGGLEHAIPHSPSLSASAHHRKIQMKTRKTTHHRSISQISSTKGDEWKPDRLVVPAVSAIQTIPIDLKQYQQELWSSDGELTPHLQQDQLVKVTEGMI